jgi:uncharacterized membrane protein
MNSKKLPHQSMISANTWFTVLMIVSLATIFIHGYLSLQHYQLKLGLSDGKSLCNISSTFNCDSVAVSRYATFFGIPMAVLGLVSQLVFLILALATRFDLSSITDSLRRGLFWFSSFIFAVSLVMGFLSIFKLGTYCLFCMFAYALSAAQLFAAWKLQEDSPLQSLGKDLSVLLAPGKWVLVLVILIPAAGWISNSVILDSYGFGRMKMIIEDSLNQWEASPVREFNPEQGLVLFKGQEPARITVVEFADFLCPHCKTASPTLEAFANSHHDVKLVFKTFPLDGRCNKAIQSQGDGLRCRLSAAMICAQKMSQKGWQAHHWIFDRQEDFQRGTSFDSIREQMGKDLGLDGGAFQNCLNDDSTNEAVLAMATEGSSIRGTPTVFVNGKLLERGASLPVLEALYRKLSP